MRRVVGALLCAVVAAEEPVPRHVLALIEGSRPDPHSEDARAVLAEKPPRHAHVVEANCILEDARIERDRIEVTATALRRRSIVFGGLPPGANGADARGRVTVELEPGTSRVVAGAR